MLVGLVVELLELLLVLLLLLLLLLLLRMLACLCCRLEKRRRARGLGSVGAGCSGWAWGAAARGTREGWWAAGRAEASVLVLVLLVICSVEEHCEPIVAFPGCLPGYWIRPRGVVASRSAGRARWCCLTLSGRNQSASLETSSNLLS